MIPLSNIKAVKNRNIEGIIRIAEKLYRKDPEELIREFGGEKAVEILGMSGIVHTGVEVHRMDSEMSRLVEQPWLQLMCCTVCLLHGRNFK